MTTPAEPPNGRDRLDASVAGQKIGLTTNNLVAVVFIGLIGVLLWMFWGSGQVILQRDIADRHRIAQEHERAHAALRQDMQALKQAMEQYHTACHGLSVGGGTGDTENTPQFGL